MPLAGALLTTDLLAPGQPGRLQMLPRAGWLLTMLARPVGQLTMLARPVGDVDAGGSEP